ncbi:MAG: glycosyl hydrolase [Verrucomicrobiales bacterium]
MKKRFRGGWPGSFLALLIVTSVSVLAGADDSQSAKALFADPPRQYSTGPLWVWNDMLTEEQIKSTMADLAGQKVRQVWVHPRPGLMTPYLSSDWFRLWKVALAEAERLDMNVWIYDENSYPSGFAGGLVQEAMPESRGIGLHFKEVKKLGTLGDDVFAVYRLADDGFENVTDQARSGEALPEAGYLVATIRLASNGGWYGGKSYVDLLRPGVTEKFIEITLGAYQRELGEHFGGRVPGWFTDEPHLMPAGGIHWSDQIRADFQNRWGYDLADHLPSLRLPLGDWKRVRHNYYQLLLELFVERWAKPCYAYAEKHNLELTGHYWEHGWPGATHVPDNMAMYAWQQRPAIDNLMNEYSSGVHGQFGNARTVRELSSVANQFGRERTLCETYGAGGWDLRMEDMKRIGDWLYVLGVNTLNEHLSYITIRGARKRDHPQSFSYHTPWWESYHKMEGYFTRLSLALSEGEQVHHVLLLEPTTTAWMYQPDPSGKESLNAIGDSFQNMINALEEAQAEYDIGCEDILGRHGRVETDRSGNAPRTLFAVGERRYDMVVLPPHTENLNEKTIRLLEEYVAAGGRVMSCGEPPSRVEGQASDRGRKLAAAEKWRRVEVDEAIAAMRESSADGLTIHRGEDDQGLLFHHRRRLDDGEILFLVNTSIEFPSSGMIDSKARGVEKWDLDSGEISPYRRSPVTDGVRIPYSLPPCGSLLLFLSNKPNEMADPGSGEVRTIPPGGPPLVSRLEPNVLTIDYVDATAGGETLKNTYFYKAQQFVFQKHGMPRNPWDSAVQFRDELITKQFPPESGFSAAYRFTIEQQVPRPLHIVIERPDLYTITCNGKPVTAKKGDWWLDKSFGKVDIGAAARIGENVVTIQASPFTVYHELESAYVLGDFSLRPVASGFVIVPPKPLPIEPIDSEAKTSGDVAPLGWNQRGYPFYAAGVAYTESFAVPNPAGQYVVALSEWRGSVAKVSVNGHLAGYIGYRPWECDVTKWIQPGDNKVEVVVIGTLRNTLGPHHAGPMVGKAWPKAFWQAPETGPPAGKEYSTLGYGLFAPFVLRQTNQ